MRSFVVIISMDWIFLVGASVQYSAKIDRIPLSSGEILKVQDEKLESYEGRVMSTSVKEVS